MRKALIALALLLSGCALFLTPEQMEARRQRKAAIDAVLLIAPTQAQTCDPLGTVSTSDSNPSIAIHNAQEAVVDQGGNALLILSGGQVDTSGGFGKMRWGGIGFTVIGTAYKCPPTPGQLPATKL